MQPRVLLALFVIMIIAISYRGLFLIRGPFLDTVSMSAFLSAQKTIENAYVTPLGYIFAERGLVNLIVAPYRALGGLLSTTEIALLLHLIFVCFGVLVTYLLCEKLTESKNASLLASLLYATSQTGVVIEAFNRWSGDVFVPVLTMLGLLFVVNGLLENGVRRYLYFFGVFLVIAFSLYIWNGGPYVPVVFALSLIAIALSEFVKDKKLSLMAISGVVIVSWVLLLLLSYLEPTSASAIVNEIKPTLLEPNGLPGVNLYLNAIILLGQFQPNSFSTSSFLNYLIQNKGILYDLPFVVWALASIFLASFLAALGVLKFGWLKAKKVQRWILVSLILMIFEVVPLAMIDFRFNSLLFMPIAILGGSSIANIHGSSKKRLIFAIIVLVLVSSAFSIYDVVYGPVYPSLGSQYKAAMMWIATNTPKNATFLSFDQDGTALELWANRTALIDGNFRDSPQLIDGYYHFLFAKGYNFSFVKQMAPDYLLLRDYNNPDNLSAEGTNAELFVEAAELNITDFAAGGVRLSEVYAHNGTSIYKVYYDAGSSAYNEAIGQPNILSYYNFLYARAGNFTYLLKQKPSNITISDVPNRKGFNGSNIQYLIEWALNPHPAFSYDGVNFSLEMAVFSNDGNKSIIVYNLSYKNAVNKVG